MTSESRYIKIKKRSKCKDSDNCKVDKTDDVNIEVSKTIGTLFYRRLLSSHKSLFLSLLVFRVINSLMNQTQSVPDEFWQSVEVAHKWAFDIGYLTWEWLPQTAIRTPVYPLIFAIPFKILQLLHLDGRILIIKLPGLMHAVMAAICDYCLYMSVFKQAGQSVAQWALFNQLVNWFTFYSSTRTLSNTLEWCVVMVALYEYQRIVHSGRKTLTRRFLFLSILCFILRPTALVILFPICVHHLFFVFSSKGAIVTPFSKTLFNGVLVGSFTMSLSLLTDKHFYGRWTCSQWNFLHFNLLTDVSQNYGVHPWHWYLTNGIPAVLLTQLPLVVLSVWSEWRESQSRNMVFLFLFVVYAYSCLGHKEFRFIFPLMPIMMLFLGRMFARYSTKARMMAIYLLLTQVPMILYMSLIHQRGGLDVVMALGRLVERHPSFVGNTSAVFLMPCHSTPWSSHLHHNISARFLTCHPQITGDISLLNMRPPSADGVHTLDEADLFYEDPSKWLRDQYPAEGGRPTLWVMFEQLQPHVTALLAEWHFRPCRRFFHAHWPTHGRHSQAIVVFCRQGFVF